MRTETRTVCIGENVGPIDWAYDFRSHFNSLCTSDERRDEACARSVGWLRRIDADFRAGLPMRATTDGGWPRCGVRRVVDVGMYDGWPYWRPTPSVQIESPLGGAEWHAFSFLTNVYAGEDGSEALP